MRGIYWFWCRIKLILAAETVCLILRDIDWNKLELTLKNEATTAYVFCKFPTVFNLPYCIKPTYRNILNQLFISVHFSCSLMFVKYLQHCLFKHKPALMLLIYFCKIPEDFHSFAIVVIYKWISQELMNFQFPFIRPHCSKLKVQLLILKNLQ